MEGSENKICRACLTGDKNMFDLFTYVDTENITLADMLMSCATIEVNSEDTLSHLICAPCIKTMTVSFNFKKQCERSDKLLRGGAESGLHEMETKEEITEILEDVENNVPEELSEAVTLLKIIKPKNYKCELCDKSFFKYGNFQLHMKTHNTQNECAFCGVKCESYKQLRLHNKEHHKVFKCHICDKAFSTGNALNGHMRCHRKPTHENGDDSENNGEAEYICVVGDKNEVENTPNNLDRVLQEGVKVETESFNCSHCDLGFVNEEELTSHLKVHDTNHECSVCQVSFSLYDDMIIHNKSDHNIFNCKRCTKSFLTPYALSGHMRHHVSVSKGRPSYLYKCPIENCNKKFSSLDYLRRHKSSHLHAKKVFLCNLCGKTYNSNNSLYYHLKMHKNERPYVCSYCGNSYKLMCHLKSHVWKHTGQRPHECKICGKRFTRRRVLRKHLETNCGSKKRRKTAFVICTDQEISEEVLVKSENVCSDEVYIEDIEFVEAD